MEEIEITHGDRGRDKIKGIEETYSKVIVHYEKAGQCRDIIIPREMIDFVGDLIKQLSYGELYASKYIYLKCVEHFNIESEIVKKKLVFIQKIMEERQLPSSIIKSIMNELKDDKEFMLMNWEEMIGTRSVEESFYFKIYGCIKYWEEKDKINYNKRGYIMRIE